MSLVLLLVFALGVVCAPAGRADLELLRRWVRRVTDNIAMRVSPCPRCEGLGWPVDTAGEICNCPAGRRSAERSARAMQRTLDEYSIRASERHQPTTFRW